MGGETTGIWAMVLDLCALGVGVLTLIYVLLAFFVSLRRRGRHRASADLFKAPSDPQKPFREGGAGVRSASEGSNGFGLRPSAEADKGTAVSKSVADTHWGRPATEASTPDDNPYQLVVELAAQGMEQTVIAHKTGIPKAEIDLILKLQGLQSGSAGM